MEDTIGESVGEHKIVRRIGTGSVFLGVNKITGAKVVLKQYSRNAKQLLSNRELQRLSEISHKSILPPLDIIKVNRFTYCLYEYSPEEDLATYISRRGELAEGEVRRIIVQLVEIFLILTKNRVAHRNIKPQNILVSEKNGPAIKLCDFGVMRKRSVRKECYVAPEVASKEGRRGHSADVWSIGAVAYFLINGKPPQENLQQKRVNDYMARNDVSAFCLDFLFSCLQYEKSKRLRFDRIAVHPFLLEEPVAREKGKKISILTLMEELKAQKMLKAEKYRFLYAIGKPHGNPRRAIFVLLREEGGCGSRVWAFVLHWLHCQAEGKGEVRQIHS